MATNEAENENGSNEVTQTWRKFASSAKKAGFRDGAADGRNEVFQISFDEGYMQGYRNGFAIGQYKGALRAKSISNSQIPERDVHLDNSRRGWCQICNNEKLLHNTTDEIIQIQTQFSNDVLKMLHSKYSPSTKVILQNKLE